MDIYKKDFVNLISQEYEITKKEAQEQYEHVFSILRQVLAQGDTVYLPNTGHFTAVDIGERHYVKVRREGNNSPKEWITVPPYKITRFVSSASLKKELNS